MYAALVIAAGKTAQGDRFEPSREVGTLPAIQRVIRVFQHAGIERVVVVCGESGDKAEKLSAHMGVDFVYSRPDAEMLESVKVGIDYLQHKCDGVMIAPAYVPLFAPDTVHALMAAEGTVCIPSHSGVAGHPVLLRPACFPVISSYAGDGGLTDALEASGLDRHMVDVKDEGILANLHDENDYGHLLAEHSPFQLRADIRIRLVKEKPFFGPGTQQILELLAETGSLRDACRRMGISYSKGRSIVTIVENQVGYAVIESKQGGKTGGYSVLTQKGEQLVRSYIAFSAEAKQYLNQLFAKHFIR